MSSDLCPGIRKTVTWLQEAGFHTTDSGDGISNEGMGCELPHANVFMTCDPPLVIEEARRLRDLLRTRGIEVGPLGVSEDGTGSRNPHLEASYDPSDDIAALCLFNVDDKLLFG